jgi:hypothetical protein
MKFYVRTASGPTRTFVARLLAFVLLSGIVHAVTFGAAHSHSDQSASIDAGRTAVFEGQVEQAFPEPFHYRTDRQECLICLFHQQLFNSVVHTPFFTAEQVLPEAGLNSEKLHKYSSSFTSTPIVRLSGRAPPRS